jgi:hypothetical protein
VILPDDIIIETTWVHLNTLLSLQRQVTFAGHDTVQVHPNRLYNLLPAILVSIVAFMFGRGALRAVRMTGIRASAALLTCVVFASTAEAACEHAGCRHYPRSKEVWHQFVNTVPCPIQVTEDGECREIIDHFIPLCLGGPDAMQNLWWEDPQRSYWKDEIERNACRTMRQVERAGNDPHGRRAVVDRYLRAVEAMGGEERARAERSLQELRD